MNLSEFKYKANYYAILLLAFVIPLERKLTPPLIILFLITSLLNNKYKKLNNPAILIFTFLFFLYLFGIIHSNNVSNALTIVVEKLSLLIFPVAIYLSNIDFKNKLNSIFISFIDGCVVSSIISIIVSLIGFYFKQDSSLFFYGNISTYLHSSYFAMYLSFGLIIIYSCLFYQNSANPIKPFKSIFLLIYFSVFIVLLSSKTGLFSLIIIHTSAILYYVIKNKTYLKGLLATLLLILGFVLVYQTSSVIKNRINELLQVVNSGDTTEGTTTGARIEIWKIATELIKTKPIIGYGTGDVTDVLTHQYNQKGFDDFAEKHLNAHNQFLQTSIALGLIGGLTLVFMLIIPLFISYHEKHYLYIFFIILIALNFITESMLERQTGVVFYAFFNSLLYATFVDKRIKP